MSDRNFKVGDVVVLKSGGPKMTVEDVSNNRVTTVWFVGSAKVSESFDPETLMFYKPTAVVQHLG